MPRPWALQVKLVDAGFIWTEPHSKRLKVKLTIQAEVMNGAILQQSFVVEYVVENHMCLECTRAHNNPNSWTAVAQVGARTGGRRPSAGAGWGLASMHAGLAAHFPLPHRSQMGSWHAVH